MRPIQDIAELQQGHVLYHSAFGFARVDDIGEADVRVSWEAPDKNLPRVVSRDTLRRVYSLCRPGGFFERALAEPVPVQEMLHVEPLTATEMLLEDLAGPQSSGDIKEWMVTLGLFTEGAFDRWWDGVRPQLDRDDRFRENKGLMSLVVNRGDGSPIRQLDDPMLSPGKRLDLTLGLRDRLGEDVFRTQVVLAWRAGGVQVRDLALQALASHHPQLVLQALLQPGPDNAEALIHALRRASWEPNQFDDDVLVALIDRVKAGVDDPTLLHQEGRLVAAFTRWWPEHGLSMLVDLSDRIRTQQLAEAALDALPPGRAQELNVQLLDRALTLGRQSAVGWLTWQLLDNSEDQPKDLGEQLLLTWPRVGKWILENYLPSDRDPSDLSEDPPETMEIELEPLGDTAIPLADLPPRNGRTLVMLACALARRLAEAHEEGLVVHPSRTTFSLTMSGAIEITEEGDPSDSPRPPGEEPSFRADIYACGVLLIEAMMGRVWPRNIPADRAIPYLRHVVQDLPPSALAPLDCALHPDPLARPADGRRWTAMWESVARSEAARGVMDHRIARPLHIGYDSHIGFMKLLQTQTNQDTVYAASRHGLHLLMVCDGISTANAGSGDVASGITSHVVSSLWEQALGRLEKANDEQVDAFMERALGMANRAVCEAALRFAGGDLRGRVPMGSTAVVAVVRGSRVTLAWLGDSRAYLVGRFGAALLTADMNQAGERFRAWNTGQELVWDPAGFALVGYIGHFNEYYRAESLVPRISHFTLLPGERLVICSDGITDYIGTHHPSVSDVIREAAWGTDPADAAQALVSAANRGGGGDNCTVIVATPLPRGDDETEDLGSITL
ncbi:MAG: serine/threonine protein phosphatase PrpC [Kiritimatiellia bacterium]|jgi:serine/threonine protein phosphatase PrpC